MSKLVLYHGPNCTDGFTAAWAAWKALGDEANYVACEYGSNPDDRVKRSLEGASVWMIDYSCDRDWMISAADVANEFVVLDHHESARRRMEDLEFCRFNMDKSGARMAWEHFHSEEPPALIKYVEDRDLWNWDLPDSEAVNAAIASRPFDFDTWTELENTPLESLIEEGRAILRRSERLVEMICENVHRIEIGGYDVPAANTPVLRSEVAGQLSEGEPFGVAWSFDGESWRFSLRKRGSDVDLSQLAESYGGGGHEAAAGFRITSFRDLPEGLKS